MRFVLQVINSIAVCKLINHTDIVKENEVEITEEQYNQINEFPLKLTIQNGQVISWEVTELPPYEQPEPIYVPTIEERLTVAEDTINFLLGL